MSDYPTPIVSTEWLAAHLNDPQIRIVDIRGHVSPASTPPPHYFNHLDQYQVSHISGAVFIDWVREITDPDDPRHAQIAKPDRYAAAMERAGISNESDDMFVVAYDDANGMFAARLWWSLNYYGHDKVAILDGGWNKWIAESRPTTADVPTVPVGTFKAVAVPQLRKTADQVVELLNSDTVLLDARSADEYNGKQSRAERMGHIPGAVCAPRQSYLNPDGTLLPPDQLREKFAAQGVTGESDTVIYCNGGVSASFGLLAMKAAGLERGALYDGSWKEWGNDPTRPIES